MLLKRDPVNLLEPKRVAESVRMVHVATLSPYMIATVFTPNNFMELSPS
jgi:hypothetical protein